MKDRLDPVDKFDEQIIDDNIDYTKDEEISEYDAQEYCLEEPEQSRNDFLERRQQGKSNLKENYPESRLGASEPFIKRVIPPEVEDTEFNNMSSKEKLDTIKNNIFQFVAFIVLFFVFLQIVFGN